MTSDMPAPAPDPDAPAASPTGAPPAGWLEVAPGVQRWWDGRALTDHYRAADQAAGAAAASSQRSRPTRMVTKQPVRTSHTFHLIMSILTCGVWAVLVWIPITVINAMRHQKVVTKID